MPFDRQTGYQRDRVEKALRNWRAGAAERERAQTAIARGRPLDAEAPERIDHYARRLITNLGPLAAAAGMPRDMPGPLGEALRAAGGPAGLDDRARERIIGALEEFLPVMFVARAAVALKSVGRIIDRRDKAGFGTGFLVAPNVLITNAHVLRNPGEAADSAVQFRYEIDVDASELAGHEFRLEPDRLYLADEDLDFALVAVADRAEDGADLASFGHLPLAEVLGKIAVGKPVNIVQHPDGARKQVVFRDSLLKLLPAEPGTIAQYDGDTKPGSSGAPVFSDFWEVVALHHSGVPATDAAGDWLNVNGAKWSEVADPEMRSVKWVANEGTRVSSIVARLRAIHQDPAEADRTGRDLIASVLDIGERAGRLGVFAQAGGDAPGEKRRVVGADRPGAAPAPAPVVPAMPSISVQIPLTVTLSFGEAGAAQAVIGAPALVPGPDLAEARRRVEDYADRAGFDRDFLGLRVELPRPQNTIRADVATLAGSAETELRYDHFSVLMSRSRRLAYVSAGNMRIDAPFEAERRDPWAHDPRLPREGQADDRYYARNDLDRGHLFRRADGAWGETAAEARRASDDTFHWTNIAPQHFVFNQSGQDDELSLWGLLENHVTAEAERERRRVNVFNGPIFGAADPVHRDLRVPMAYWKALAIRDQTGALRSYAFVVGQEKLLIDLPQEAVNAGRFAVFQVKLRDLETRTGLDFGELRAADVLDGAGVEERFARGSAAIRLRRVDDMQL